MEQDARGACWEGSLPRVQNLALLCNLLDFYKVSLGHIFFWTNPGWSHKSPLKVLGHVDPIFPSKSHFPSAAPKHLWAVSCQD